MSTKQKLKIFKDKKDKYHFKTKDNCHIDIEYKDKRLKFKLHKWGKEASIEVFLDMVEADTHTYKENKIEIEDSKKKIRVYPIDTFTTGELYGDSVDIVQCHDGGLRYDLKYFEKPPTNFYDESLVCKNTRWSKQPFLTQEDIEQGVTCPINVEGSYAIYHISRKNNQYMTGKMLHRYRPIAIDADGNKSWCDMEVDRHIDPTNMRITIPQQFLDDAKYPITVDPDFGVTGIGGTPWIFANFASLFSTRRGNAFTMPAPGGTANYIRVYMDGIGDINVSCKAFINQKDSGGANIHGQIAVSAEIEVFTDVIPGWEEFTLGSEDLVEGVDYILNVIADKDDLVGKTALRSFHDVNGSVECYNDHDQETYGSESSPWTEAPFFELRDFSVYCNYDEPPYFIPRIRMMLSFFKRGTDIGLTRRVADIVFEGRRTDMVLDKRRLVVEVDKRRMEIEFKKEE